MVNRNFGYSCDGDDIVFGRNRPCRNQSGTVEIQNSKEFHQSDFDNNYEPDTINLCKTMEHTLDNIMNKEQI